MDLAIKEAKKALKNNNVPIGAVIIKNNDLVASAHNDEFWHAEILCIQKAQKKLGKFLDDCSILVTLEPCPMCLYACGLAHIKNIVCGANRTDCKKDGKIKNIEIIKEIKQNECACLIKKYFEQKRS